MLAAASSEMYSHDIGMTLQVLLASQMDWLTLIEAAVVQSIGAAPWITRCVHGTESLRCFPQSQPLQI